MTLPALHTTSRIQDDWQRTIEQAVESGREPLLELGMDRRLLNNLPILLALATWNRSRYDVTTPLMMTGGVDALWPVPLLYVASPIKLALQPNAAQRDLAKGGLAGGDLAGQVESLPVAHMTTKTKPLQLLYGGADSATYLASLSTHANQRLQSGTLFAVDLPAAMQPIANPFTQPHVNANWYTFPLTLMHTIAPATATGSTSASLSTMPADDAIVADDPWLTWAALLIVVLLVLLAL
ncbi:MAG: hypothetical protein KDE47_17280, partial [Caldilineaceae bacterium]|nr:hypothetical protein [Caldilineaceae bacterium]